MIGQSKVSSNTEVIIVGCPILSMIVSYVYIFRYWELVFVYRDLLRGRLEVSLGGLSGQLHMQNSF
jgi:hypothetical protein